jgi:DNA repair exonuclease SbcCD ATPase subunit
MIKFTNLKFSNVFSYGENNYIRLDKDNLTQLVGKNGFGKSSIALIIEEVLFNTNSKKIKKSDILNRYTKAKSYTIELTFEKDGTPYTISTTRTNTTSIVKLMCGSLDISSHTATGTYKQIETILGFDAKTFSQIVYQSSVSSLEFLTATDSARKKFLIELLNLSKYTRALEVFKELVLNMSKQVDATQAKIDTINSWLDKYSNQDLVLRELEKEADPPTLLKEKLVLLLNELANIDSTNKRIAQNNTYKRFLATIDISIPYSQPNYPLLKEWIGRVAAIKVELKEGATLSKKPSTKTIKCPTCSQDMDNSVMFNRILAFEQAKPLLELELKQLESNINEAEHANKAFSEYEKRVQEWEKYNSLVSNDISAVPIDRAELENNINSLKRSIDTIELAIANTRKNNKLIEEHNSKVRVISSQLVEMKSDLASLSEKLLLKVFELTNLNILVKTFSTTGLVAYKIECLVKDLEQLTNEYLSVLADGRFQLSFKISSSDKLNVIITDNGKDIDIVALSSGERARVNVATLLAIRKLMQALSNSRTNLLILDETIENLDAEGKEKLLEVLLAETDLNTFLVSHGFSHPLIEKINVIKEHNISRLE